MPRVSIIMATHNRAGYLKKAVSSVRNQTFRDWELIIMDDGSTDDTAAVLKELAKEDSRIHFTWQVNQGAAKARNAGIRKAQGEFVAFLDDDDQWLPEKLEKQIRFMEAGDLGMSYTLFEINGTGAKAEQRSIFPEKLATNFNELIDAFFIPLPTVMVRKSCLDQLPHLFDSRFGISEDQHLWLRIAQRWKLAPIKEVLARTYMDDRPHLGQDRISVHQHMIAVMASLKLPTSLRKSRPLMRKKAASLNYAIARDFIDRRQYAQAARYFLFAVWNNPLVGLTVQRKGEPEGGNPIVRIVKAYLAILWCVFKGVKSHGRN